MNKGILKQVLLSKKIIILTIIAVIMECFLLYVYDYVFDIKDYSYKTTATIDYIGLPDGTVFVSCLDANNTKHEEVIIDRKQIIGKVETVEAYYGLNVPVLLNPDTDRALWIAELYKDLTWIVGVPLVYLGIIILEISKNRNVKKR